VRRAPVLGVCSRRMLIPTDPKHLEAFALPFIRGTAYPKTAAELMASRYVAYSLCEIDYLIETHDPQTRAATDRKGTEAWARGSKFHGLEILDTLAGSEGDDKGEVEFVARYTSEGVERRHHERSTFCRIDGRWFFSAARIIQTPVRRIEPKVGRNDPCPCGNGKKFKKCHGVGA